MDTIVITGKVVDGSGLFRKQIVLPVDLIDGHETWMNSFVQGTLNIQISIASLPATFQSNGLRALDLNDTFKPAIYRCGSAVPNNTIQPNTQNLRRGDLQLWKALLENQETQSEHQCFLLRRVESGYRDKAEILGQHHFKSKFGFSNGHRISITIYAEEGNT